MKFPKVPAHKQPPAKTKAAKTTKPKATKPAASQPPLIAGVRHDQLDALCESIGRINDKRLRLQQDEDGDKQAALDYMLKHNIPQYHHYGTELVVRDGKKTLSVRKHKEVATSTMPGDEALGG